MFATFFLNMLISLSENTTFLVLFYREKAVNILLAINI